MLAGRMLAGYYIWAKRMVDVRKKRK